MPADATLLDGEPLQVDQSALTGESLPVSIHPGGKCKMGSTIKRGEINAIVVATGRHTFFGKAADLLNIEDTQGRFQKILFKITLGLLAVSLVLCTVIGIVLLVRGHSSGKEIGPLILFVLSVVIVLLVASIPIAMQVVCTSTMAVGSRRLASRKVIVARLSAIEELAGMTILCSDKTGTLTQNKLSLKEPLLMGDMNAEELVFYSALSAKRVEGAQDAIDKCIVDAVKTKGKLTSFEEIKFVPFNPTDKRTESTVRAPDGSVFKVTKGAPQVILHMAHNAADIEQRVGMAVQSLADRGFRALGVAISYTGQDEEPKWEFQGVLALFDPPRYDTKTTIETAVAMGVEVKMITGDQTAIAKETCRELGMGTNILNTAVLEDESAREGVDLDEIIMAAHGFAEVYPEHKFMIVDRIRKQGYVTGMTGDGVNDAPALKRADIGIAVEGATDAAKAAADIVLIEPGLSVIIEAIQRSRKIFQRMRNYCIYRIACTIQLLFFFFFAVLFIEADDFCKYNPAMPDRCPTYNGQSAFTLPVVAIVIITILNDGTIITIARDKVIPDKDPQKWALQEVVVISSVLGFIPCISSILVLLAGMSSYRGAPSTWYGTLLASLYDSNLQTYYMEWGELEAMLYMKISLSDFLTVFAARTRGPFFERRPGYALACAFVFATTCSTVLSLVWPTALDNKDDAMKRLRVKTCLTVWVYNLLWFVVQDIAKVLTYHVISLLRQEEKVRLRQQEGRAKASALIEADNRAGRFAGVTREVSSASRGRRKSAAAADVAGMNARLMAVEQQVGRISKLEKEIVELRALIQA